MTNTPVTSEELAAFVTALAAHYAEDIKKSWPTGEAYWTTLKHTGGTRYAKIISVRAESIDGSAYCFIDLSNGDILKAASWKAPAAHARGNIRVGNASNWWNGALGPYGAAYLR